MKNSKRLVLLSSCLALFLFVLALLSVLFGSVSLSVQSVLDAFFGLDRTSEIIILKLRVPRLAAAFLAGFGLSVAGLLLQTVTDNDLCAPNIIGVNSGAGFAVMAVLCLAPKLWRIVPLSAFVGALVTTLAVISISGASRGKSKSSLVLSGVAVSSVLGAGISFFSIKYPDVMTSYTAFSVGGFSGVTLKELALPALVIAVCFALSIVLAPKISLLSLGDEGAKALGVNVAVLRLLTVVIASALCASVVTFAGLLGFVGLIVPHIAKKTVRGTLRLNIPFAAFYGSALCILADLVGRTLFSPAELPAGIIMAFVGAPFFIYLLLRGRKSYA